MKEPKARAIPDPGIGEEKLVGLVKGIIEKKIESLELQEQYLFITYEQIDKSHLDDQAGFPGKLKAIKTQLDHFIEKLELISYARKLLKEIARALRIETVRPIFFLLYNDKYLFYDSDTLNRILQVERAVRSSCLKLSTN